jgi:hypothetical protein
VESICTATAISDGFEVVGAGFDYYYGAAEAFFWAGSSERDRVARSLVRFGRVERRPGRRASRLSARVLSGRVCRSAWDFEHMYRGVEIPQRPLAEVAQAQIV